MPPKPSATRPRRAHSTHDTRSSNSSGRSSGRGRRGGRGRGRRRAQTDGGTVSAPTSDLSALETLPPALFQHVVEFFGVRQHKALPRFFTANEEDERKRDCDWDAFALLSKAVGGHTQSLAGQRMRSHVVISVESPSRKEMLTMRRCVVQRRAHLRELIVSMGSPDMPSTVVPYVAEMVSQAPQLEKLDLASCRGDVALIVQAAATNCRQLKELVLPDHRDRPAIDSQPLMDAVFAGLPLWQRHGAGLRRLRVPARQGRSLAACVDLLLRVYTYCPKIEHLEGGFFPPGMVVQASDQWIVDRTVWERFCATCCNLQRFDWVTFPWTTDFFELFGKYPKPQLTSLTLRTSMTWDWSGYFEQLGTVEASAIKASGYGATANRLHLVLKACRSLTKLEVILNSRVGDDEDDHDAFGEPVPRFKRENAINKGLISDRFCQELVRSCPYIEDFTVEEDYADVATTNQTSRMIMRFQDPALQSLARLQRLSKVTLPAVNVTGDGLFALVNAKPKDVIGTRQYLLTIGDYSGDADKSFYNAVQRLLQRLLNCKRPLEFPKKRLFLQVNNGFDDDVDHNWSIGYLSRLKGSIRALRRKYPSLTFRVDIDGLEKKTFQAIYAFGMYTSSAEQPEDSRWLDMPDHALVEDMFVREEVMEDYEDDDSDEDYGDYGYGFGDHDDDEDYESDDDDGFRYGDYGNERGFYGMGGHHFFNGLQLPDIGPFAAHGPRGDDDDDYDFFDHAAGDY